MVASGIVVIGVGLATKQHHPQRFRLLTECPLNKDVPHDLGLNETFQNVEIALRIYPSMIVAICTGERSFSKLKLIENYLRCTMGQDRLISRLAVLGVESKILRGNSPN